MPQGRASEQEGGGAMEEKRIDKKEQITLHLPVETMEVLKQEADKRGYTITDLIIFILWNYVDEAILQE